MKFKGKKFTYAEAELFCKERNAILAFFSDYFPDGPKGDLLKGGDDKGDKWCPV